MNQMSQANAAFATTALALADADKVHSVASSEVALALADVDTQNSDTLIHFTTAACALADSAKANYEASSEFYFALYNVAAAKNSVEKLAKAVRQTEYVDAFIAYALEKRAIASAAIVVAKAKNATTAKAPTATETEAPLVGAAEA